MSHKLEIRAFFFNAKTDYLPYYKNFNINIDDEATAKDLLVQIQEENENFSFPKQKLIMKINGLVVEAKQSVSSLVERFGTSLQIDPVNSYRANNGLRINDDDFMQSFELLAPYASESDLKYYKTLYALHYASETENFNREYIGDAVLLLAHKMITEGSEHSEAILKALTSVHSGLFDCEYENNLFNAQDHTETIHALKALAKPEEGPSLCAQIMARFFTKEQAPVDVDVPQIVAETIQDLEEKQVAHYYGLSSHNAMHNFISEMGMKGVHFSRAGKLSGLSILEESKDLALSKAGSILLDAYDSGAEVLVVEDVDVLDMFKKNFSAIEKTIGRKMLGLELISSEDFVSQLGSSVA